MCAFTFVEPHSHGVYVGCTLRHDLQINLCFGETHHYSILTEIWQTRCCKEDTRCKKLLMKSLDSAAQVQQHGMLSQQPCLRHFDGGPKVDAGTSSRVFMKHSVLTGLNFICMNMLFV